MPQMVVTMRNGEEREIDAPVNYTLMEIVTGAQIDELEALCGGCLGCGTCHVYIDPKFKDLLPPRHEDEDTMLEGSEYRTEDSRLSCQIRMSEDFDGLCLTIAPED